MGLMDTLKRWFSGSGGQPSLGQPSPATAPEEIAAATQATGAPVNPSPAPDLPQDVAEESELALESEPVLAEEPEVDEEAWAAQQSMPEGSHLVTDGDTLESIADHHGVDPKILARVNEVDNPDLLYPGQVLQIPPA